MSLWTQGILGRHGHLVETVNVTLATDCLQRNRWRKLAPESESARYDNLRLLIPVGSTQHITEVEQGLTPY